MDGCTVKQKFASDNKTTTSLGTKAHLKNTEQYDIKRAKEKKH